MTFLIFTSCFRVTTVDLEEIIVSEEAQVKYSTLIKGIGTTQGADPTVEHPRGEGLGTEVEVTAVLTVWTGQVN